MERVIPGVLLIAMLDAFLRVMRWRLLERLVETASPADVQIRMIDECHLPYRDLAQRFWDSWEFVPVLNAIGALSAESLLAVSKVNDALKELDRLAPQGSQNTDNLWTDSAIRRRPEWEAVRRAAGEALRAFERMGVRVPSLSDPDFSKPRSDAP